MDYQYEVIETNHGYQLSIFLNGMKHFSTLISRDVYLLYLKQPKDFVDWLDQTFDDVIYSGGTT